MKNEIDTLVKSFYGRKRIPPSKIVHKLNTISTESWAAADVRVREFFNKLYSVHGTKACEELVQYTKDYPLLRTILYSMLGHRYFDSGNIPSMRAAYWLSLEAAKKVPHYNVHTNGHKWAFSTNFYWARHETELSTKEACLVRIMSIPIENFHRELIITKFIRALQWLMKNSKAVEAIEKGKASLKQFQRDGRITKAEYDAALTSFPKFEEAEPGTHDFNVGNP